MMPAFFNWSALRLTVVADATGAAASAGGSAVVQDANAIRMAMVPIDRTCTVELVIPALSRKGRPTQIEMC
jgi:hypothetical protein